MSRVIIIGSVGVGLYLVYKLFSSPAAAESDDTPGHREVARHGRSAFTGPKDFTADRLHAETPRSEMHAPGGSRGSSHLDHLKHSNRRHKGHEEARPNNDEAHPGNHLSAGPTEIAGRVRVVNGEQLIEGATRPFTVSEAVQIGQSKELAGHDLIASAEDGSEVRVHNFVDGAWFDAAN